MMQENHVPVLFFWKEHLEKENIVFRAVFLLIDIETLLGVLFVKFI